VDFLFMPEGEDPDSFVRSRGREAFDEAPLVSLSDHLIQTLQRDAELDTREGRAALAESAVPYLRLLPDGVLKGIVAGDIAGLAGVEPDRITVPSGPETTSRDRRNRPLRTPARGASQRNLMGQTIGLLLARPALAQLVTEPARLSSVAIPGSDFLCELVGYLQARPDITCAGILEHWRGSRFEQRLGELASAAAGMDEPEIDLEREFLDALDRIGEQLRRIEVKEAAQARSPGELTDERRALLRNPRSGRGAPSKE